MTEKTSTYCSAKEPRNAKTGEFWVRWEFGHPEKTQVLQKTDEGWRELSGQSPFTATAAEWFDKATVFAEEAAGKFLRHSVRYAVIGEVLKRRQGQIEKGWTEAHDDKHGHHDLVDLVAEYAERASASAMAVDMAKTGELSTEYKQELRGRLLDVAALAVAAIEKIDREGDGTAPKGAE